MPGVKKFRGSPLVFENIFFYFHTFLFKIFLVTLVNNVPLLSNVIQENNLLPLPLWRSLRGSVVPDAQRAHYCLAIFGNILQTTDI